MNQERPAARGIHLALRALVRTPNLDALHRATPDSTRDVLADLTHASELAWSEDADRGERLHVASARLEVMRALYELNRLRFYWFDDPAHYANERSVLLHQLRDQLESPWQRWLSRKVEPHDRSRSPDELLSSWAARDLAPSSEDDWFAQRIDLNGYRRLLEILSLNGLVEASQLSRVMGGAPHPVQSTLFRILMEEYGAGRAHKKHSHFFAQMLAQQGMSSEPEAYFSRVPWQVLSAINHAFHLTEQRRHYLRFCGAFTYTELSTPVSFRGYAAAVKRLGLSDGHADYWALHVREDERHGAWMVDEVMRPLFAEFPEHAHDVLFGYAQQRVVEAMAGAATERACRDAQEDARES